MFTRFRLNQLSTRSQLFLAIAGSSLLLVVLILLSMRWLFIQNFTQYLAEQERNRLQQVAEVLSEYYGQYERRQLTSDVPEHELWRVILSDIQRDVWLEPERFNLDPDLSFEELNFVTDSGELIFGPRIEDAVSQLVLFEGQVLGILSTPIPRGAVAPIDAVYAQNQQQALLYAGGAAVVLAALVAFLFANGLRRRLQSLRHSTEALAAGDASTRFSQEGMDDVAQLGRTLNKLAASLAANEYQRREFMADIAHELRTPLTVLQGELEAIEDGVRKPELPVIQRLQAQAKQLTRLVQDLDTLAQADLGGLNYRWESFDLNALTVEVSESYHDAAQAKGLSLRIVASQKPLTFYGDPERLRQVLTNVLTNSIRYTDAPGTVDIHISANETWIRVQVDDSAPSVSTDQLPRIFDRFYRVQSDRARHTGGSGLGLALVERIVRAHEGRVKATASALGGLCIIIELPRQFGGKPEHG